MIAVNDYATASSIAYYADYGTFGLTDGSVIEGPVFNVESNLDDPDGIGCIDVIVDTAKNVFDSVYADKFAWAEFPDALIPELPERLRNNVQRIRTE